MKYIYESPKKSHRRSSPVDESDVLRRNILERSGWRIVERIHDEGDMDEETLAALGSGVKEGDLGEALAAPDALDLPDDMRLKLAEAGYTTVEAIHEASDEELEAIEGIGKATVAKIRQVVVLPENEGAEE